MLVLAEFIIYASIILLGLAIIGWFTEETKIGRKLSNWLLNKIYGTHFENLD